MRFPSRYLHCTIVIDFFQSPTAQSAAFNSQKQPINITEKAKNGFTFKENCPDTRNTKVIGIYHELREYGITPIVSDPEADAAEAERLCGMKFIAMEELSDLDAVILAVAHNPFKTLPREQLDKLYAPTGKKVLLDLKGILNKNTYLEAEYLYWGL